MERDEGPYTCRRCLRSTWNDCDMCNDCTEEGRAEMELSNRERARALNSRLWDARGHTFVTNVEAREALLARELDAAEARGAESEREACAKVVDVEANKHRLNDDPQRMDACRWLAAAIRARGAIREGGNVRASGWIGVDFDGTLAEYHGCVQFGEPIPAMMERVQGWLAEGVPVRIVTARAADPDEAKKVQDWCERHGLPRLPVTDRKDFSMIELWDDRAVSVEFNTGRDLRKP